MYNEWRCKLYNQCHWLILNCLRAHLFAEMPLQENFLSVEFSCKLNLSAWQIKYCDQSLVFSVHLICRQLTIIIGFIVTWLMLF